MDTVHCIEETNNRFHKNGTCNFVAGKIYIGPSIKFLKTSVSFNVIGYSTITSHKPQSPTFVKPAVF